MRVVGVAIGGSIARGQDWQHSDLELGFLVDEEIAAGRCNVVEGRGVELFQFVASDLQARVRRAAAEDEVVAEFPIQFYRCQIYHDPTTLVITHISSRLKGVVRKGLQHEQGKRRDGVPDGLQAAQQNIGKRA